MAYDSATDTALASQAYQRALAVAAQRRSQLNTQFGLRGDPGHEGQLDNSAAGQLGSIYQGNLDSVMGEHQAELSDRRRGFAGTGGLAGKASAQADRLAQQRQALGLSDATTQLGGVTQQEQAAGQDYEYEKTNIGSRSVADLANNIVANPVLGPEQLSPFSNPAAGRNPAQVAAQKKALAVNPRAMQTARNRF